MDRFKFAHLPDLKKGEQAIKGKIVVNPSEEKLPEQVSEQKVKEDDKS